ncbi:MAG: DUF3048 C-terminal domain-containing protein, partial [Lachnospiraceae bacterium]|nr:DUF3048 C-terminal domain-containing protein [Lachnospiraceae bacterium]
HYGQAAYALPYLESDDVDNISGLMGYGGYYFFREYDIQAPHNAYTSGEQINQAIDDLGYRKEHPEGFQGAFRFVKPDESADLSGGTDAHFVQTGYMVSDSYFVYDDATGLYMRYQYDEPETDGLTGEQLSCRNIIFEYQNASTYDVSVYVHFETTGSGYGKYFSDGKAIDIRWERDSFYSPARYYRLDDGSELKMNCGKTWVSIIKNKHVGLAMYGPSYSEAVCVVDADLQAQLEEENAVWEADFKANETAYRAELDRQHAEALASHGGISKVE